MSTAATAAEVWDRYWEQYHEDTGNARRMRTVAQEYPVHRGLAVSYTDLVEMGVEHERFKNDPDAVLGEGVAAFERFVRGLDVEDAWERAFDTVILHVRDLPSGFEIWDYSRLEEHLNRLTLLDVTVVEPPEYKSDMMEAAFVCVNDHLTRLHQGNLRHQDIDRCPECGESTWLEIKESTFARIQRARVSGEGFEDVLTVVGGSQSMDEEMAAGDRYRLTAVPRGDIDGSSTHGDVYLDTLHLEPADGAA